MSLYLSFYLTQLRIFNQVLNIPLVLTSQNQNLMQIIQGVQELWSLLNKKLVGNPALAGNLHSFLTVLSSQYLKQIGQGICELCSEIQTEIYHYI